MAAIKCPLNVATEVVGGVRTLTAHHDLTIVNAGATGFSKDPDFSRFSLSMQKLW